MNIDEGGGGPPTAAIGGGAAVAILLMVGLGCYYLGKKRMAGSQSPVALTAVSLTTTKEKDLESGSPATKGPIASGNTTTYSVELTKIALTLALALTLAPTLTLTLTLTQSRRPLGVVRDLALHGRHGQGLPRPQGAGASRPSYP